VVLREILSRMDRLEQRINTVDGNTLQLREGAQQQ
jgi:hypothetical protein